jgi:hypothetical protein
VRVWEVPTEYFECNRASLQNRAELIPYIYTAYRQAFDTGLSIIRPMCVVVRYKILHILISRALVAHEAILVITASSAHKGPRFIVPTPRYYDFPEQDMAYKADEKGNFAQYMFGDDILAAPVLAAADHNTQMAKVRQGRGENNGLGYSHRIDAASCSSDMSPFLPYRKQSGFLRASGLRRRRARCWTAAAMG